MCERPIAQAFSLLPYHAPNGTTSVTFYDDAGNLYLAEATHLALHDDDGQPTGDYRLDIQVRRFQGIGQATAAQSGPA